MCHSMCVCEKATEMVDTVTATVCMDIAVGLEEG